MKKFNFKFMAMQMGMIVLIALVIAIFLGRGSTSPVPVIIVLTMIGTGFFSLIYFLMIGNMITDKMVTKTEEKYSDKEGFGNSETFYTDSDLLKINVADGKLAYISNMNPREFQVVSAKDITDVKAGHMPGVLGGTSYVYFQFNYKGKRKRIATFKSNNAYSLKSAEVLEAMSKADYFSELIKAAVKNAK